MQSSDLLLPPGAQMLQQPDMAFLLTFRTGSSGEFRKDIHVPNFSGAFAEAAQLLQHRIRDACVIEGESPESRFKAAGTCPQIVNLFGRGVAVPHVKHAKVKKMVGTIGRSGNGIDFAALDHQPVYSIVLLLSPENQPQQHLQAMNIVFSNLQKDMFRRWLRQAATREAIVELLEDADQGR